MSQRLQQIQQGSSALKPPPGYSQQDDKKKSEGAGEWWKELNDDQECPITLEPLNSLPYPPFRLGSSLFDGLALASYVVSRGIFQNPLNRQDLTRNDCVRLDDYLQAHCFAEQSLLTVKTHPSRRLSVTEAFVLHQRVRVEDNQSDSSSSRAQVLRHTATAALAGLFVYGNDQRNSQTNDSNSQEQNTGASIWSPQPQELLPSSLLQDWGLDLNRNVEDTALQQEENYRVIDDDEAMNVATQRHQYQQVQEAFPRLSTSSSAAADENSGSESVPSVQPDTEFVAKVHRQAAVDTRVEQERQLRLEVARQKLLQEALQRREERRQKRLQQLREGKKQQQVKEQEQEELTRVRQEIEAWREEQWEKLRLVSEKHQKTEQAEQKAREEEKMKLKQVEEEAESEKRDHLLKEDQTPTEEELVERKRQKAAEKKRRARERQKAKKAQQRAVQEEQRKQEELEAKRAAASKQCDACGQGILGHGFEKFDQHFCSPACARTAKPKR